MRNLVTAAIFTALLALVVFSIAKDRRDRPPMVDVAAGSPESVVMLKRTVREKRRNQRGYCP